MGKILSILLFVTLILFGGNALLYVLNVTDFLIGSDLSVNENMWITYLILIAYFILLLGFFLLIQNRMFRKWDKPRYYFVLSSIYCIAALFILKVLLNIEKMGEINNILSLVLVIFLSTYVFYYSIYYSTLIEYKRNH